MIDSLKREVLKQLWDQWWHFVWAAAASGPWALGYAYEIPGLVLAGVFVIFINTMMIVHREAAQFPSRRTSTGWWAKVGGWDPWLDWAVFAAGGVTPILVVVL